MNFILYGQYVVYMILLLLQKMGIFWSSQSSNIKLSENEIMNRKEIIRFIQKGDIKGLLYLNNSKNVNFNDPVYQDEMGRNILHHVIESSHFISRDIRNLVNIGVDVNKKDINGKLPLDIAMRENKTAIAKILMDAADGNLKLLVQQLQDQLHDKTIELQNYKKKSTSILGKRKTEYEESEKSRKNLERDYNKLNAKFVKVNTEKNQLEQKIVQLENEIIRLKKEITRVTNELAKINKDYDDMKKTYKNLREQSKIK